MAGSSERQLNVKFVGDAKGLKAASSEAESSLSRLGDTTKNLAVAFGAAFGATKVVSFLQDAAAAAAADEKSQKLLTLAITDNTTATTNQIAQTEQWITATQNATGVLDDQLRPALANLVGATHDVGTAQELMQVALDISAARGLDVESVSLALVKAYDGNVGALGRLGINVRDVTGKTMDFQGVMEAAAAQFGGAASAAADTTSGKLAIMNAKFEDMKEEIGSKVLPIMVSFESFMLERIIPAVEGFSLMLQQLPGNMQTGVAVTLNAILSVFQGAINTIIAGLNWAINAFNNLPGMGTVRAIAGKLGLGGGKVPNIPEVSGLSVSVPYYPTGLTMAGATAGLGLGGATYSPGGALAPGNATPPIPGRGGGGGGDGGGGGGKSAAELKNEADQKAIGEALKMWANAREHQREIEDNMYEDAQLSANDYLALLNKRLAGEEKFSDAWMAIERDISRVKRDEADKQKEIDDKKTADAKAAADEQLKLAKTAHDAEMDRLAGMSDEELAQELSRRQHGNGAQILYSQLDTDLAAGRYSSTPGGGVMISGPVTVVANDPRQLVQQLQAIDRTYGGVPINVRTPA